MLVKSRFGRILDADYFSNPLYYIQLVIQESQGFSGFVAGHSLAQRAHPALASDVFHSIALLQLADERWQTSYRSSGRE